MMSAASIRRTDPDFFWDKADSRVNNSYLGAFLKQPEKIVLVEAWC